MATTPDIGQTRERRIVVENSPALLGPKDAPNRHLLRGQAVFRGVLAGIPNLPTELEYTDAQAIVVKKSFGLINGDPSADTSDGYVYRASTGSDKSLARIRSPKSGIYELTGEGAVRLNDLELRLQRKTITPEKYEEQRALAEPLGKGTGGFEEFVGRMYAVDPNLLGSNRFWNAVVEATHSTTGTRLAHADNLVGKLVLYPLGRAALYKVTTRMGPEQVEDGLVDIQYKKGGGSRTVVEWIRPLGKVQDQHGTLELFGRVANVPNLS